MENPLQENSPDNPLTDQAQPAIPQQSSVPTVHTPPETKTPAKSKKQLILVVIIIATILSLGLASFFVYQNHQSKQQVAQAPTSTPTPDINKKPSPLPSNPSPKANEKRKSCEFQNISDSEFEDIENLIETDVCRKKYSAWISHKTPNIIELKYPEYYQRFVEPGGSASFTIIHPVLGKFDTNTLVIGTGNKYTLSEQLCTLSKIGHLSKNPSKYNYIESYYKNGKGYHYFLGPTRVVIGKEDTGNIWAFSVLLQENRQSNKDQKYSEERQLIDTDDFKCFVRSVNLLDP